MRLWLRFALVIAMVSVVSLLTLGRFAHRIAGDSATDAAELSQVRDARAVGASVDRWAQAHVDFLAGWLGTFPVASIPPERLEYLQRAVLTSMSAANTAVFVDGEGRPIVPPAHLPPEGTVTEDPVARSEALMARLPISGALESAEGFQIGGFHRFDGRSTSVPVAVVASYDPPILLGVELSLVVADELDAQTETAHAVRLLDADGNLAGSEHPLLDVSQIRSFLGTSSSVTFTTRDVEVQGAVVPAGETGWSVVVLEPADQALEAAQRIREVLLIVIGVVMLVAIVFGFWMGHHFTQPIARLRDTALQLAEGRYGTRAEVESRDEVGELAYAFNHLSARLKQNQTELHRQREEIEAFNRDLQDRVDEATSDLREAQERLVRSGQLAAVAQLGAGMAHELNNPLMAILGVTQVLRAQEKNPVQAGLLADLEAEAVRCREVLETMLRLTADGPEGSGESDLHEVLEDVRAALAPVIRDHGVEVVWGEVSQARVRADRGRLVGALAQLLTALLTGMPDGATVRVTGSCTADDVILHLTPDREVGIDRDDWMASGLDVWVATQTLDRLGGQLTEPVDTRDSWRVRLPGMGGC